MQPAQPMVVVHKAKDGGDAANVRHLVKMLLEEIGFQTQMKDKSNFTRTRTKHALQNTNTRIKIKFDV